MKWTIPSFLIVLIGSIPVFAYFKFSDWGALYGNLANIAGLSFAFHNYLYLSSQPYIHQQLKTVWSNFALGTFLWLLAQTIETYCELILLLITYGTLADSLWLIGYVPIMFGLHKILTSQMKESKWEWSRFRSLLLLAGVVYLAVFVSFIREQLTGTGQRLTENILDFCYPTMDFILIIQCLMILKVSGKNGSYYSFSLLSAAAFLLTLVGDGVLSRIQDFQSFFYLTVDLWYISCYFLMAIATVLYNKRVKPDTLFPLSKTSTVET